jgi:hypothetical protein
MLLSGRCWTEVVTRKEKPELTQKAAPAQRKRKWKMKAEKNCNAGNTGLECGSLAAAFAAWTCLTP